MPWAATSTMNISSGRSLYIVVMRGLFRASTCSSAQKEHVDGRDKHGHDDKGMKDIDRRLAGTVSKREPDSRATSTGMTKEE